MSDFHFMGDEVPMDDLNACYQREFIPGSPRNWRTPLTWTDTSAEPPDDFLVELVSPTLHESYKRVLDEAEEIWLDRQGQYGMTPFATKPEILLSLVQVKLWRLEQDFGAEDGWLDLLNYAAIGLMVARNQWKADE